MKGNQNKMNNATRMNEKVKGNKNNSTFDSKTQGDMREINNRGDMRDATNKGGNKKRINMTNSDY